MNYLWNIPSNEFRSSKAWWNRRVDYEYLKLNNALQRVGALRVGDRTLLEQATDFTSRDIDYMWTGFFEYRELPGECEPAEMVLQVFHLISQALLKE